MARVGDQVMEDAPLQDPQPAQQQTATPTTEPPEPAVEEQQETAEPAKDMRACGSSNGTA